MNVYRNSVINFMFYCNNKYLVAIETLLFDDANANATKCLTLTYLNIQTVNRVYIPGNKEKREKKS